MVAVSAGLEDSLELVTLFLQRGALVNVQDQSGASALWLAAQDGLPSVVQVRQFLHVCCYLAKHTDYTIAPSQQRGKGTLHLRHMSVYFLCEYPKT